MSNDVQSIIIYRNPMEAAFWEMASNGNFFPAVVGVIVFFAVFLLANQILTGGKIFYPKWYTTFSLSLGGLAGLGIAYYMFTKI